MGEPYRLSKPIARRDFTIEEVSIGEPSGATMLLLDDFADKPIRLSMELIINMAEVDGKRGEITMKDLTAMPAVDVAALGELATGVLDDGLPTGATPSVA